MKFRCSPNETKILMQQKKNEFLYLLFIKIKRNTKLNKWTETRESKINTVNIQNPVKQVIFFGVKNHWR